MSGVIINKILISNDIQISNEHLDNTETQMAARARSGVFIVCCVLT